MMNYVGNITILDRGDAPAQAIIDRNARSLAQRVADETKDELSKVLERVDNVSVTLFNVVCKILQLIQLFYLFDVCESLKCVTILQL